MKILVVCDTHGHLGNFDTVLQKEKPIDMLFHCGDIEQDSETIPLMVECPVYLVGGNCDWGGALSRELIAEVGQHRIMIVHGHNHGVYHGLDGLYAAAEAKGCDIVCYGHTHVPEVAKINGVTIINPGSLTRPKQDGHAPSYAVLTFDEAYEEMTAEIRYLSLE